MNEIVARDRCQPASFHAGKGYRDKAATFLETSTTDLLSSFQRNFRKAPAARRRAARFGEPKQCNLQN